MILGQNIKNYCINGNFDFWQRGASYGSGTNRYTADRWYHWFNNGSVSRQAITDLPGSRYCLRWNADSGSTQSNLLQAIEQPETKRLVGKKVTVSMYLRKGSAFDGSIDLYFGSNFVSEARQAEASDLYSGTHTSQVTTSWSKVSFTTTSAVLSTAQSLTLSIEHRNVVSGGANNYLEVAQVMINEGEQPADFEIAGKSLAAEFLMCQRFYCIANYGGTGNAESATQIGMNFKFPVEQRTPGTLLRVATATIRHQSTDFNSNGGFTNQTYTNFGGWTNLNGFSGLTTGALAYDRGTSSWLAHDCEL